MSGTLLNPARPEPFDSSLILSLSPFAEAQGDAEFVEGSKGVRLAQDRPFDSPLILSLSPFDDAQGDPEFVEASKDGRLAQDRPVEGRALHVARGSTSSPRAGKAS